MEGVRGILATATIGSRFALERVRADARLRIALAVSLAGHLALAAVWHGNLPESRPVGHSALTVEFRAASSVPPAPPTPPEREREREQASPVDRPRVLTSLRSSDTIIEEEAKTGIEGSPRPAPFTAVAPSNRPPDAAQAAEQAPGGDKVRRGDRSGEVAVVLVISDDGHAQRIIWNQLPAMSAEQFRRLENRIRSRVYPGRAGQVVSEYIDVLALMRLDSTEAVAPQGAIQGANQAPAAGTPASN